MLFSCFLAQQRLVTWHRPCHWAAQLWEADTAQLYMELAHLLALYIMKKRISPVIFDQTVTVVVSFSVLNYTSPPRGIIIIMVFILVQMPRFRKLLKGPLPQAVFPSMCGSWPCWWPGPWTGPYKHRYELASPTEPGYVKVIGALENIIITIYMVSEKKKRDQQHQVCEGFVGIQTS